MLKRGLPLWVMIVPITLLLAGCSETRFVSVQYVPGQALKFFIPLCGDERLEELRLEALPNVDDPGDDRLLWSLQAAGEGRPVTTVEFGQEPAGFRGRGLRSLASLVEGYFDQTLAINARTDRDSDLLGTFILAELPTDGAALLEGTPDREASPAAVEEAQQDSCSPSRAEEIATVVSRGALAAVSVAGITWLVLRWLRSRRRPVAS